jgi:hypothetical protein
MNSQLTENNLDVADCVEVFIEKTKMGEKINDQFLYVCGDEWHCKEFIKNIMEHIGSNCKRVGVKDLPYYKYFTKPNPTVTKHCIIMQRYGRLKRNYKNKIGGNIKEIVGRDNTISSGKKCIHKANVIFASTIDVACELLKDAGIRRRAILIKV